MSKKTRSSLFSVQDLTLCALFVALLSICAHISIPLPFYPVPFTMQNIVVLLCGLLLPLRCGLLTMGTYTLLGLLGVPVFSSGAGPSYVLSPTFGYIIGFFAAVVFLSMLHNFYANSIWKKVLCCIGATLLIHLFGSAYYLIIATYVQILPNPWTAVKSMFLTFAPIDMVKIVLSILIVLPLEKQVQSFLTVRKASK